MVNVLSMRVVSTMFLRRLERAFWVRLVAILTLWCTFNGFIVVAVLVIEVLDVLLGVVIVNVATIGIRDGCSCAVWYL